MTIETLTFLLAFLGYLGLAANTVLAAQNTYKRPAIALVAPLIVAHVLLVWAYRYDWQIALATRNGYAGFFIFHSALLCIIAATFLSPRIGKPLIILSFLIVSTGASGAVFKYEVVSIYRIPVITIVVLGLGFLIHRLYLKYKQKTGSTLP